MENKKPTPFMPKDIGPHAIVLDLTQNLDEIEELICVVKMKDGTYTKSVAGTVAGVSCAVIMLQKFVMEYFG